MGLKVKHLVICFDRIPLCFPSRQSSPQELDAREMKRQYTTQDGAASFVAGTGAVNNCVFFSRDQRWVLEHFVWRNPLRLRNDLRIGQEVERLPNIKKQYLLI